MTAQAHAVELARRLTEAKVGRFRAHGDLVVLDDAPGDAGHLLVIDAGSGRTEQVAKALQRAQAAPHVAVIAARHFSRGALAALDVNAANYMDDRNLHVRLLAPPMLVRLEYEAAPAVERPPKTFRLAGAAGGVALALLSDPARDWKVADLASAGRVSLGAAQSAVVALESEGLLERHGRGPGTRRRVTDPSALLDRYAQDAAADRRVAARGFLLGNSAAETMRAVSERLKSTGRGVEAWFTGVAAAQMVAPHVTAVRSFEAWITSPYSAAVVLDTMGAMPAEEGANLVVLQGRPCVAAGSEHRDGVPVVSVFRMYADALVDPARGEEQAEHLRETVIGF
jgi:hypothetical protein